MNAPEHFRVPMADPLSEVRVRVVDGQLDVRVFRRPVDDFRPEGMHPTAVGVSVPLAYAELFADAVLRAALLAADPRQDAA